LPLALGRLAARRGQRWAELYSAGLAQIERGDVHFNDSDRQKDFANTVARQNTK